MPQSDQVINYTNNSSHSHLGVRCTVMKPLSTLILHERKEQSMYIHITTSLTPKFFFVDFFQVHKDRNEYNFFFNAQQSHSSMSNK